MKIYVITQGSYSDYHICAVTDKQEDVEALIERYSIGSSKANAEEYDTEDYTPNDGRIPYYVEYRGGDDYRIREADWDYFTPGLSPRYNHLDLRILAKSEEHALKIAYDKVAQWRAEREGL